MCNLTNPKHSNGKRTIGIEFLFAQEAICTAHCTMYMYRSWNALIDIRITLVHTYMHIAHTHKQYRNYPEFYLLFGYFMRCKHV